ncbi:MAG: hypothetical protein D6798_05525 [Deltaproteobacteria bacterium]|nr:MAG: hypothetical protein D6798_05525 [Deltaproteobacteria bacterium]
MAMQERLRPSGDNNPWIPDIIEDWLWGPEETPRGPDTTPAPAPGVTPPTPSPPDATSWWDAYRAESSKARRQQLVFAECDAGRMQGRISALTRDQRHGAYRDAVQEALDFLQLHATLRASGTDEAAMAQRQAEYMTEEERRLAQQQGAGPTPTPQQIEQARAERNQQDYVVEPEQSRLRWPRLSPAEQQRWNARGAAARRVLAAHINRRYPQYPVTESQIIIDFAEVERLGAVAFNDGQNHCTIGFDVVEAVELNPEFAVSTVVHELFGHNEFDRGFSVSERLFVEAVARQRGVRVEDVQLTDDEWSRFNYFESEIASLVWEFDLYIARDDQGHVNPLGSPQALMVSLMRNLQSQWAPDLVRPLLSGLYTRFRADPDVSDAAARFFADNARQHLGITL